MQEQSVFEGWCILELLGHRKLGGYVKEETIAGSSFLRIDVLRSDGSSAVTQFYSPSAVYAITPVTEEVATQFGVNHQPVPVSRWELPAQTTYRESSWSDEVGEDSND